MDPFASSPYPDTDLFGAYPVATIGPQRDPDERPARKPKPKEVLADVQDLLEQHAERLQQTQVMARQLMPVRDQLDIGHFESDEEDIIAGEMETFPLQLLRAEHEFNIGIISQMERFIEHLSRERIDDEEVLTIEDACYYAMACFERQYYRAKRSSLKRAKPNILQRTGALVSRMTVNPDDPHCGVAYSLVDPQTFFPIWEGERGLSDAALVYQASIGKVIGDWADPGGSVERAVTRIAKARGAGRADRNELVEVKEYWNRDWVTVLVEDKEILTRQHGLGKVPFIVTLGGFETPMDMRHGERTYWNETTIEPGWHRSGETSPDIAAMYRPWAYQYLQPQAIMEAVAGRTLYEFKRSNKRPMVYEFDVLTRNQDTAELSQYEGAINKIPLGNKLSVLPTAPDGPTLAMLNGFLEAVGNMGLWTQIRTGQIPPQTPSAALGTMFDLGGADRSAITDAIAMHERAELEWFLELRRDWGPVMGERGNRGAPLLVPSRDYTTPAHLLTAEIIQRAGCYLNVTLHIDRPDPALAQWIATMMSSGLSSPETAMRKTRYVPDPLRELQRIDRAMLEKTPEVATQKMIRLMTQERDRALAEGDYDSADDAMVAAMQLEWNAQQQMMAGTAPSPSQGGTGPAMGNPILGAGVPNPNGMPGPARTGAPLTQQGLSMPELGFGTGGGGGRPMGTTQTKPGMDNTLVTAPVR